MFRRFPRPRTYRDEPGTAAIGRNKLLGGAADVLGHKRHRGALSHLGELAGFALYGNDRQFHDVRYRWEYGQDVRYQVRIWKR